VLPGRTPNATIDGRMDQGPGLTSAEFSMLVQEEREEMDRLASGLETWSDNEDKDPEPNGSPNPCQELHCVTIIDEPTAPTRAGAFIQRGGPSVVNLTGGPSSQGTSILWGPRLTRENTPDANQDLWYGLTERGEPEVRIICLGDADLNILISQGASFKGIFLTRGEAEVWMNSTPPPLLLHQHQLPESGTASSMTGAPGRSALASLTLKNSWVKVLRFPKSLSPRPLRSYGSMSPKRPFEVHLSCKPPHRLLAQRHTKLLNFKDKRPTRA
jgi:hypothetical protein